MWVRNIDVISLYVCIILNFVVFIIFWRIDGKENNFEMFLFGVGRGGGKKEKERERFRVMLCICVFIGFRKGFYLEKDSFCFLREV